MTQTFDTREATTDLERLNVAPGSVVVVRDEEWIPLNSRSAR